MLLVSKLKGFIISGIEWKAALEKALGNKKYLPSDTVEALAKGFAEAYGEKYKTTIYYQQTTAGSWAFYTDEACEYASRHETATKQWYRTVGKFHDTGRKAKVFKQVDEVSKVAKYLKSSGLTKAQMLKAVEKAFAK